MIPFKDDNPTRTFPTVTILLIAANVAVFAYQLFLHWALGARADHEFVWRMGAIPYELIRFKDIVSPTPIPLYLTPLTAMFIHGGFMHIGGNMLYLWIFGNNVEDVLGHFRFLLFYLACGLIATSVHVLSAMNSQAPMVGASGAIAGVLGAYFIRFPGARVHVLMFLFFFIRVVRIPAVVVLGFWFLMQLMNASAASGGAGGSVAWFAHIGGFVAGLILMLRYGRRRWDGIRIYQG